MSATLLTPRIEESPHRTEPDRSAVIRRAILSGIILAHVSLSVGVHSLSAPFEDEGLYVSEGHLMIRQLLEPGYQAPDAPGAYFSGAPALYPVLAALADSVGGLYAARLLSLVFTIVAALAVYGMTRRLSNTTAALVGTAAYAFSSPVIYQSHFATYDAMMMMLFTVATWLAIRSVQEDRFLWSPVVGILLLLAALTKYAGLVYAPIVVLLAIAEGWTRLGWTVVRRGVFAGMVMVSFGFAGLALWGHSLLPGFMVTTLERNVINPASTDFLLGQIGSWVGPMLAVALIGAVVMICQNPRRWLVALILLGASVVAPIQQLRIGESTSLGKHLAFGLVFAAPLVGVACAAVIKKLAWKKTGLVIVAMALIVSTFFNARQASEFLSSWAPVDRLAATLRPIIAEHPDQVVLGEQPAGERYLLRDELDASMLADTYYLSYKGKTDMSAYQNAINDEHFSVVWLNGTTTRGAQIKAMMDAAVANGRYTLAVEVPRTFRDQPAGSWSVYTVKESS